MRDENGRLRKVLSEKDYEINQLKKRVNEEKEIIGKLSEAAGQPLEIKLISSGLDQIGSLSADAAATRIVDLAKKVRELTAQLEAEKTKNKQLGRNCNDLESKLAKMEKERSSAGFSNMGKTAKELNEDPDDDQSYENDQEKLQRLNKELKEKFAQVSQKMIEYKSQTEILKQDLKKAHKVS